MTEKDYKLWLQRFGGWIFIWLAVSVVILRWLSINQLSSVFGSASSFLLAFGRLTGLVGLVLYAINLLLAARTRWMENFFGGLNRVYIAHHLTGGIALILLCFHPLFIALRLVDVHVLTTLRDAARYLLPRAMPTDTTFSDFQTAASINAGIFAFVGMVVLLVLTFFVKLPYRIWLATHKFLGVAFMFAGLHTIMINSEVSRDAFLRYYLLLWVVIGLSAFVYRTVMNNIFVRRYPYKVSDVQEFGGKVTGLVLEPMEKALDFKPGQFVFIRFLWSGAEGVTREAHPFSIASAPHESGKLALYVKNLGDYTSGLKHLKVGTVAELEGAYGKFSYTNFGDRPQIWIAGGIGVTPFLSMARSYNQDSPNVDMIYSVVSRSELLDQKALAELLPSKFKGFRYFAYAGDEQEGFLTAQKVSDMVGGLEGKEIFICGPPPMMKSLRSQLNSMGISNRRIHTEEFSMQ